MLTSYLKIERTGVTSLATLFKIAHALDVSPAEFFQNDQKFSEPIDVAGLVTKEDLKQVKLEIETAIRMGFQKLRDELSFSDQRYKIKRPGKK